MTGYIYVPCLLANRMLSRGHVFGQLCNSGGAFLGPLAFRDSTISRKMVELPIYYGILFCHVRTHQPLFFFLL